MSTSQFQTALISILTLVEGSRLQNGDTLSEDLGSTAISFWLRDRVGTVFKVCEQLAQGSFAGMLRCERIRSVHSARRVIAVCADDM